jgi:hypothetical protein
MPMPQDPHDPEEDPAEPNDDVPAPPDQPERAPPAEPEKGPPKHVARWAISPLVPAKAGTQFMSQRWIPAGVYPRAGLWPDPGAGMIGT